MTAVQNAMFTLPIPPAEPLMWGEPLTEPEEPEEPEERRASRREHEEEERRPRRR